MSGRIAGSGKNCRRKREKYSPGRTWRNAVQTNELYLVCRRDLTKGKNEDGERGHARSRRREQRAPKKKKVTRRSSELYGDTSITDMEKIMSRMQAVDSAAGGVS